MRKFEERVNFVFPKYLIPVVALSVVIVLFAYQNNPEAILLITIASIVLLNITSLLAYVCLHPRGGKLQVHRKPRRNRNMNYLICGMLDFPRPVFRFLLRELTDGITLVNYHCTGWNADDMAQLIADDIKRHRYREVTVYAISIGVQAAHKLERLCNNVKIVAINPCPAADALKRPWRIMAQALTPVFAALIVLLGWLCALPIIPVYNGRYSLLLIAEQICALGFTEMHGTTQHTIGVIYSQQDQFLDNAKVAEYYPNVYSVTIDTPHAYTIRAPQRYQEAVKSILDHHRRHHHGT